MPPATPATGDTPVIEPVQKSHGQVLKSSAMIGGSLMLGNVGIGAIRTKAMALMLATGGVGLMGTYWSISELVRSVAGMGINSSGVREIAESVGTGDSHRIARTVTTLRRVALVLGALGGVFLVIFSRWVSRWSFGDYEHSGSIALLGLAVLFGEISAAQSALVQGMRRVSDLAKINILGALYGTVFSVPIVYFYWRRGVPEQGVVPSLVCVAAMNILTSWWFARKVKVEPVPLTMKEIRTEASGLLKMGVAFMSSGLMLMGSAYLVRVIVWRRLGEHAAGNYQAAWQLGGLYVNFILQAMAADFFPRLSAVANDNKECNRLVNEQAEVGLLIAGPGLLGTLSLAPLIIIAFYSHKFGDAVQVLRWICLGMAMRVVSWPMGSILLAKGLRNLFFWSELVSNAIYIGLIWFGVQVLGLKGTGIAFFAYYVVYAIGIYIIVRRLSGFRWSPINRRLALVFVPLVVIVFVGGNFLSMATTAVVGATLTMVAGFYSLKLLCTLIPFDRLARPVQKLLKLLRMAPAANG
jgi:PST family polysaccharide transporter